MKNEHTSEKGKKSNICLGIVAHVDAGKTTLSESLLYSSGAIRKLGRVDNQDAFLDTDAMEKERGITIFSKQAVFEVEDTVFTLLDTPGHVDFSAEMERTLGVLDYAILVISGADGVQGHTKTLWQLLQRYEVPVFLFVNKMDQQGTDRETLLTALQAKLSESCIDFSHTDTEEFYDQVAMCDEAAMEQFLEQGTVSENLVKKMIAERKIFPCYFGSALKLQGVDVFLQALKQYTVSKAYGTEFGARVYKIARDDQGVRETYMKITGGTLAVRDLLHGMDGDTPWEEKVNQIRIYSGGKYENVPVVQAGDVCAITGPDKTYAGQGLGMEKEGEQPLLAPVLTYQLLPPQGMDPVQLLPKCRILEEEDPQLHILWEEEHHAILVQLMGEVQIEILKRIMAERFGVEVDFGPGKIVYKETIASVVEGVGHFEPLRHYAEVHLLLEPGEPGSGIQIKADCSEDILAKNWQRLVMTHLAERTHRGVLTGSPLTDVVVTLVSGRAHQKHTEGGDFRQATYRALRQGLMKAESVLLEPIYRFRLEIPAEMIGKAMTDMEQLYGHMDAPVTEGETAVLTGTAPVATMQHYQRELNAYTRGKGRLSLSLQGYEPCHNTEEVVAEMGYDPERDLRNTPDSVFCAHGAGFVVPWYEVESYMHMPGYFSKEISLEEQSQQMQKRRQPVEDWIGTEEIDAILARTFDANRREKDVPRKGPVQRFGTGSREVARIYKGKNVPKQEYLLVDGYNVIFAWESLHALADENIHAARDRLMDILCDYQGIRGCELIVVFDAYRVEGHATEVFDYHNIHVVYTKEAETADQYIEKFTHTHASQYRVTVATSDGLEQIIIRGEGAALISSRELETEIARAHRQMQEDYEEEKLRSTTGQKNFLLSEEQKEKIRAQIEEDSAD
ncbi:MAG: NYN domain-containing protein [Roseburia sp.]